MNREVRIAELFEVFDLDGNGVVSFQELLQLLESCRSHMTPRTEKWIQRLEAQVRIARETHSRSRGSMRNIKLLGGIINFAQDGEPTMDPESFTHLIMSITEHDPDEEFDEFVNVCVRARTDAFDLTHGSKLKKVFWDIFQLLDKNRSGTIDLDELGELMEVESKSDKKVLTKWKHQLSQRQREATPSTGGAVIVDSALQMKLGEFQQCMHEYTDGSLERAEAIKNAVQQRFEAKVGRYLEAMHVNDIMAEILIDIKRERPSDVLAGIQRSVQRLQRKGWFPQKLYRSPSVLRPSLEHTQTIPETAMPLE